MNVVCIVHANVYTSAPVRCICDILSVRYQLGTFFDATGYYGQDVCRPQRNSE